MTVNILMPALSTTMEEGTLSKWLVKEGDTVTSGDLIAEIETDKATMEVESIDDGTIGKILVREGQEAVKVNEPIAILLVDGENLSDIKSIKKIPPTENVQEIDKTESKEKLNFKSNKTSKINLDTNINIENYEAAVKIALLPDQIKGYDVVKESNIEKTKLLKEQYFNEFYGKNIEVVNKYPKAVGG